LPAVRSPLERVDEKVITDVVAAGWGLTITELRYFPEGGGAYHWTAQTGDARRWFVTCDDLDIKPWLGADRDSVFDGLLAAYGSAMDLRAAGLPFVMAPIATVAGAPAERVDARHSLSVFEHADGEPGRWGRPVASGQRRELVTMLARLHRAPPPARGLARRGLEVPGRHGLEAALDDLDHPWDGGPLSEPARRELAGHRDVVVRWLTDLDRFTAGLNDVDDVDAGVVVTHGEPHPGNLIRTGAGLVLVDWDTVALGRPERDMWMLADGDGDSSLLSDYRVLTGITLDRQALAAYRLLWALADVAAFVVRLRGPHGRDAEIDRTLVALRRTLDGQEPSPYRTPTLGSSADS
jgi:spectinomycin phosphotransferase